MVRVSYVKEKETFIKGRQRIFRCVSKAEGFCLSWFYFPFNLVGDMSGTQNILHVYMCLLALYNGAFPLGPFSLEDCSQTHLARFHGVNKLSKGERGNFWRGTLLLLSGETWGALDSHYHSAFSRVWNFHYRFLLLAQKHWYYCINFLFNNSVWSKYGLFVGGDWRRLHNQYPLNPGAAHYADVRRNCLPEIRRLTIHKIMASIYWGLTKSWLNEY